MKSPFNVSVAKVASLFAGTFLFIFVLVAMLFYDFGINSNYFVKRDFTKLTEYRQTGNCDKFLEYVWFDREQWMERCLEESSENRNQIREFSILKVTSNDNQAYLQVELKRDLYRTELELAENGQAIPQNGYIVNYTMKRHKGSWYLTNKINQ